MTESPPSARRGGDREELPPVRELIETRQIRVALQPIVDLRTHAVLAHEALMRTTSPTFRSPRELFDAAVRAGCCGELGRAIRVEAVAAGPDLALFLNVHPDELQERWLLELDDPIYRHAGEVYLEITESVPLSHFRLCKELLREIRERGIHLVIDDLGAGYSNLRYIADLHPSFVKLDRALITGLGTNPRMQRLVAAIVTLCESLDAQVVAEGIETPEELQAVCDAGVGYGQGFLLARPQPSPPDIYWPAEIREPAARSLVPSAAPVSGTQSTPVRAQGTVHVSHVDGLGDAESEERLIERK